ncbi:FAD-dependent oxidoreductase [Paenibacillus riograndensis]|nr:FAD-dependent oxidoreductase [Paenibacillus riograndensis]
MSAWGIVVDGRCVNEGNVEVDAASPYPISYHSIIPKGEECTNLLVPVCLSSSHIAFGSIRMESVFMVLGQSAAVAASISMSDQVTVQEVEYKKLKERLLQVNQILHPRL